MASVTHEQGDSGRNKQITLSDLNHYKLFCQSKGLGDKANSTRFLRFLQEAVRRDRLAQGDMLKKEAEIFS